MADLESTKEVTEEMLGRKVVYVDDARPGPNPLRMFPNRFRKRKVKVSLATHDLRTGPEHILTMDAERNPFWVEQIRCWCVAIDGDLEQRKHSIRLERTGDFDITGWVHYVFSSSYADSEFELQSEYDIREYEDLTEE